MVISWHKKVPHETQIRLKIYILLIIQITTFNSSIKNPIYIKNKENNHDFLNLEAILSGIKLKDLLNTILNIKVKAIK